MGRIFKTPISQQEVEIGLGSKKDNIIMAIETSCDETACAIVKNGREVISNVIASQIKTHQKFGGVMPEVAAREHLNAINIVIKEALEQANLTVDDIDAFASTVGPGLVGCLLVGLNATKAMAICHDKPFIGVNHLIGHVCANYLSTDLKPPFMTLLISGGHTQIIKIDDYSKYSILGETIDDAIGEAYDKVARLIGLPYPGGVHLDKLAQDGKPKAYKLPDAKVASYNFSFSGLKTAVLTLVQRLKKELGESNLPKADIAASFQECVSSTLLKKTLRACEDFGITKIALSGGVAANSEIRKKFFNLNENGYEVYAPEIKYCTDNAAMIASCAYFLCKIYDDIDVEVFSRNK